MPQKKAITQGGARDAGPIEEGEARPDLSKFTQQDGVVEKFCKWMKKHPCLTGTFAFFSATALTFGGLYIDKLVSGGSPDPSILGHPCESLILTGNGAVGAEKLKLLVAGHNGAVAELLTKGLLDNSVANLANFAVDYHGNSDSACTATLAVTKNPIARKAFYQANLLHSPGPLAYAELNAKGLKIMKQHTSLAAKSVTFAYNKELDKATVGIVYKPASNGTYALLYNTATAALSAKSTLKTPVVTTYQLCAEDVPSAANASTGASSAAAATTEASANVTAASANVTAQDGNTTDGSRRLHAALDQHGSQSSLRGASRSS